MQYLAIALDSTDNGASARRASAQDEHRSQPTTARGRRLIFAATLIDDKGDARGSAPAFDVDSRRDLNVYLAGEPYLRDEAWQSVKCLRASCRTLSWDQVLVMPPPGPDHPAPASQPGRVTRLAPANDVPGERIDMPTGDYAASAIPWPDAISWSLQELRLYLAAAADPAVQALPTRCLPWTVADLTAHLAATFRRFADQLDKARAGNLDAPFPPDQLPAENLRAVRDFRGDPRHELTQQAHRFLGSVGRVDELIGHQRGPVPAGLQVMFGLNELAVHHDDLAHAAGSSYRPRSDVVTALTTMYGAVHGMPAGPNPWACLLQATGR